jgi:hypothetical protein
VVLGVALDVDPLDGCGVGLLTLGEADNAAGNAVAKAVVAIVVGVLVEDHGAADDAVGAIEVHEEISALVAGLTIIFSLDLLDITNAAVADVLV